MAITGSKIHAALRQVHNTEKTILTPNGLARAEAYDRAAEDHHLNDEEIGILRRALCLDSPS